MDRTCTFTAASYPESSSKVFRPMMTEERFDLSPVVVLKANNHLRCENKEELPSIDPSEQMKLYTPKAAPLRIFY